MASPFLSSQSVLSLDLNRQRWWFCIPLGLCSAPQTSDPHEIKSQALSFTSVVTHCFLTCAQGSSPVMRCYFMVARQGTGHLLRCPVDLAASRVSMHVESHSACCIPIVIPTCSFVLQILTRQKHLQRVRRSSAEHGWFHWSLSALVHLPACSTARRWCLHLTSIWRFYI